MNASTSVESIPSAFSRRVRVATPSNWVRSSDDQWQLSVPFEPGLRRIDVFARGWSRSDKLPIKLAWRFEGAARAQNLSISRNAEFVTASRTLVRSDSAGALVASVSQAPALLVARASGYALWPRPCSSAFPACLTQAPAQQRSDVLAEPDAIVRELSEGRLGDALEDFGLLVLAGHGKQAATAAREMLALLGQNPFRRDPVLGALIGSLL